MAGVRGGVSGDSGAIAATSEGCGDAGRLALGVPYGLGGEPGEHDASVSTGARVPSLTARKDAPCAGGLPPGTAVIHGADRWFEAVSGRVESILQSHCATGGGQASEASA